jgi:hypothetical protein
VFRVVVNEVVGGGTGAGELLDIGAAADAVTGSNNLIDGIDANTPGYYDNISNVAGSGKAIQYMDAKGGATDFITVQDMVANCPNLAGTVDVFYVPLA